MQCYFKKVTDPPHSPDNPGKHSIKEYIKNGNLIRENLTTRRVTVFTREGGYSGDN